MLWRNFLMLEQDISDNGAEEIYAMGDAESIDSQITCTQHGMGDGWLLKLDSTGTEKWQRCYGGFYSESNFKIVPYANNEMIIGGVSRSDDGDISQAYGGADIWIMKTDTSGNILWDRNFGSVYEENAPINIRLPRWRYFTFR